MRTIFLCILLLIHGTAVWAGIEPNSVPAKKAWEKSGVLDLSFVAAKHLLRSKLAAAGYREKYEIPLGKSNSQCLILWEKNGEQIIYMLWQIEVDQTGYSCGRTRNGTRKQ